MTDWAAVKVGAVVLYCPRIAIPFAGAVVVVVTASMIPPVCPKMLAVTIGAFVMKAFTPGTMALAGMDP